jgi:hypothetical protein
MAGQQHKVLAQNAEPRCSGLAKVKSVHSEIRQSWVFGLQMPSFFIKTVQTGQSFNYKMKAIPRRRGATCAQFIG